MDSYKKYEEIVVFRLFYKELKRSERVVKYAIDDEGKRKYDNLSHFFRCAVINLLAEQEKKIESDRGRPRK